MSRPVLWHLPVSHYNEKVRWALEHKGVEHDRHAPPPGAHAAVALAITRGNAATFPILRLDGRYIADSTDIIAALDQRYPDRPLVPDDPAQRARALDLEEFFDEEVGPQTRLLGLHLTRRDPAALQEFAANVLPERLASVDVVTRVAAKGAGAYAQARYRVGDAEAADLARARIVAGFDRLESELAGGDGEHLVGDSLTVADVAAASMFVPVVTPPAGPKLPRPPLAMEEFREPLRLRPGYRWVEGMFARHRAGARRP